MKLKFFVPGSPRSKGSMRSIGRGRMVSSKSTIGWQKLVMFHAMRAYGGKTPIEGLVDVGLRFRVLTKQKGPAPDLDKLCRTCLDALTKVVYDDDRQVARLHASRDMVDDDPGVEVTVRTHDQ